MMGIIISLAVLLLLIYLDRERGKDDSSNKFDCYRCRRRLPNHMESADEDNLCNECYFKQ